MKEKKENNKMEKLVSLCKRRGFIFPSSEIYGGLQGFWDFGPLGVELKNNIKKLWWKKFVQERDDVVGLDSTIITNSKVWEASGHLKGFTDELIECKECHRRFGPSDYDIVDMENPMLDKPLCPYCRSTNLTKAKDFNTMFKTSIGPVEDTSSIAFLRPETAQGIFVNFENIVTSQRLKIPFGVAQIGKAFRNEITPGNYIFRSREFEQMEIECFVEKGEDDKWFNYWVEESYQWFLDLGIKKENIRKRKQKKEELAHYAKETVDIEYKFPFEKGWAELLGVSNRTDYDLKKHKQEYNDPDSNTKITPYIIEPSFGVDRAALTFLLDAYEEVKGGRTTTTESTKKEEVVLRLNKHLAPVKVAVLPLSKKENLTEIARQIYDNLRPHFMTAYDEVASIGRRYRRQDEIGTPYCVTVDFDTLEDKAVTIRDRDTMKQDRIKIGELVGYLKEKMTGQE